MNMKNKTRTITLSALLTALTLVFLYLANIIPTSRLGIVAVASLFAVASVVEAGIVSSVFVFVGSSIIGALILPDKTTVMLYVLFFGYYPFIKSIAEKIRPRAVQWIIKLAVFNASFTLIWYLFKSLLFNGSYLDTNLIFVYSAVNIVFVLFDVGLTKLITFYIVRISKNIKKNN